MVGWSVIHRYVYEFAQRAKVCLHTKYTWVSGKVKVRCGYLINVFNIKVAKNKFNNLFAQNPSYKLRFFKLNQFDNNSINC
jgi:hypothetical protein